MNGIDKIKSQKHVQSVSDERMAGDGIFAYLKRGFWNAELETHFIHEQTVHGVLGRLKQDVKPCKCYECTTPKL